MKEKNCASSDHMHLSKVERQSVFLWLNYKSFRMFLNVCIGTLCSESQAVAIPQHCACVSQCLEWNFPLNKQFVNELHKVHKQEEFHFQCSGVDMSMWVIF